MKRLIALLMAATFTGLAAPASSETAPASTSSESASAAQAPDASGAQVGTSTQQKTTVPGKKHHKKKHPKKHKSQEIEKTDAPKS